MLKKFFPIGKKVTNTVEHGFSKPHLEPKYALRKQRPKAILKYSEQGPD